MQRLRSQIIWSAIAVLILALFIYLPERTEQTEPERLTLPDNPPDIYIQNIDLTRYDEHGQIAMTTAAASLSVYEDSGLSYMQQPKVILFQDNLPAWQVTAELAIIDQNENIDFQTNVRTVQLQTDIPTELNTEAMRVSEQGQRISSELAVHISQGKQTLNAVGMDTLLEGNQAIIHLLSDVSFYYDPS